MNIIIEGPDASGKSTLVEYLGRVLAMRVITGSKPGSRHELFERAARYLSMDNVVFDRHPCVSEGIYGRILRGKSLLYPFVIDDFYAQKPIIIYCRGGDLSKHVAKHDVADTAEHLSAVEKHHPQICAAYDRWALAHANFIYRMGDDKAALACAVGMVLSRQGELV